jgi:para-nitrobenzyl esterase
LWPRVTRVYDGYGTDKTDLIEKELTTDMMITAPTRTAARAASARGSPTFLYYYSYVRPSARAQAPGASHMDEVYALFGHMNLMPGGAAEQPDALPVVAAMQERWARFVSTGNPGSKTEPWPKLDLENQQLLEFSNTGEFVRTDFARQRLDLAAVMPRLPPG